jgi:hypothetical protein
VQIVNLESKTVNVDIFIDGLESNVVLSKLTKTVLTSSNVMDENSFSQPNKVSNKQIFLFVFPIFFHCLQNIRKWLWIERLLIAISHSYRETNIVMRILVNLACDIVKPCFQADFLVCPLLGLS